MPQGRSRTVPDQELQRGESGQRAIAQPGGLQDNGGVDRLLRRPDRARPVTAEHEQFRVDAEEFGEQVPQAVAPGRGEGVGDDRARRGRLTGSSEPAGQQAEPESEGQRLLASHPLGRPSHGGETSELARADVAPPAEELGDHGEVVDVHS